MVKSTKRGFDYTKSKESVKKEMIKTKGTNKRMGGKPQAQENKSKLIQAKKTLKTRDRVLTAAIRRCHVELAKKESLRDIDASKNQVEAAWKEFNHANARYCAYAGWGPPFEEEEQPEEARRALFEWKVLTDMMEQVVDKAEEYLESATKENSWDELSEDEDGGNELDAKVEQLSTMNEDSGEVEWSLAGHHRPEGMRNFEKVEVSVMDEVNVNKENEVNVNKETEVNVNEMNNEVELHIAHNVLAKEEMSEGKPLEVMKGSSAAKSEVKSDVNAEAKEVSGVKEVMQSDRLRMKMKEQSRCANWDPGEPVNAKVEMLDAKEEKILVNNGKVKLRGDVNWMVFYVTMELYAIVLFNAKEMLVAFSLSRFVNGFRRDCPIELSDHG